MGRWFVSFRYWINTLKYLRSWRDLIINGNYRVCVSWFVSGKNLLPNRECFDIGMKISFVSVVSDAMQVYACVCIQFVYLYTVKRLWNGQQFVELKCPFYYHWRCVFLFIKFNYTTMSSFLSLSLAPCFSVSVSSFSFPLRLFLNLFNSTNPFPLFSYGACLSNFTSIFSFPGRSECPIFHPE